MATPTPSNPAWRRNPLPLPARPTASYPSSRLFGTPQDRKDYWLPDPPGAGFPELQAFWQRLSTSITEYRKPKLHPNAPKFVKPKTARLLADGVRSEDWVRGNGASRQSRSPNWSGTSVHAVNGGTFTQVVGSWNEPGIARSGTYDPTQEFRSSVWIGFNGHAAYEDAALPQIGTMQQFTAGSPLSKHWVWFEWWANSKVCSHGDDRTAYLPFYLDLKVAEGDTVLCSVELIRGDPAATPPDPPRVARMCVCVEHLDTATHSVEKVLVMPFILRPPIVDNRRVQPTGSTANWIAELPTNVDKNYKVDINNPFLMPRFGTGPASSNSVTFQNCVAAVAANPGEPICAERTLEVSNRINMIHRKPSSNGSIKKIATTLTPRISDTSFSIQVDGNPQ